MVFNDNPRVATSVVEALRYPRLVQLRPNLIGACFDLMKIIPAYNIISSGLESGEITRDTHVVETSSGSLGLGLALVCHQLGLKLTLVSDPVIDESLRNRMRDLGTTVEIIQTPNPTGGWQGARLDRVYEILRRESNVFFVNQYDNPNQPASYRHLANYLLESLGDFDCLIGAVGSGGSMCGSSRALRETLPDLKVVGVDTCGSILFGQPDKPRLIRGLGNSVLPTVLDHTVFDEVHWVPGADGMRSTRVLQSEHGLYQGPSSGCCYHTARWVAEQNPDLRCVAVFADSGERYRANIYCNAWLQKELNGYPEPRPQPYWVSSPQEGLGQWSAINWCRRPLIEISDIRENDAPVDETVLPGAAGRCSLRLFDA